MPAELQLSSTERASVIELASDMLVTLLELTNEDGFVVVTPHDVTTHHLLLVLADWGPDIFSAAIDRGVNWFADLDDERDRDDQDLNPFRLLAFMGLDHPETDSYVKAKVAVLRRYHKKGDGHVVLQIGAASRLANALQDVFPTMMAARVLIAHGEQSSLEDAHACIRWAQGQLQSNSVHKNLSSNSGFAALLATLYEEATGQAEFASWRDELVEQLQRSQVQGLWCDDFVQNAYIFYDFAEMLGNTGNVELLPAIQSYVTRIASEPRLARPDDAQLAVLIYAAILRGLARILPTDTKDAVRMRVIDRCLQHAGILFRTHHQLAARNAALERTLADLRQNRAFPVNPAVFSTREFVANPKQVFLLTPFGRKAWARRTPQFGWREEEYDFDGPRRLLIEPTVRSLGYSCIEADSQFAPRDFMEKIWQQINESALVIADLTSCNPNVMYEAGIAHTLGKPVVFITQHNDYVPTDLRRIEYVQYDSSLGREEEFKVKLARALKHALGLRDPE